MSSVTMFEHDMTTTKELDDMVRLELSRFQDLNGAWHRSLDLWRQLVQSKTSPGEYQLTRPLRIACVFPDYQSFKHPRFPCLKLTDGDIIPTRTSDPTKAGWYECELSMHIDPVWELDEELAFVHDPPSVCRVSLRVSELTFCKDADVAQLQEVYATVSTAALQISSGEVYTQGDIHDLIRDIKRTTHFFHHPFSEDIPARIWWDLVISRHSKNEFRMTLPFTLRITSKNARLPRKISDNVMVLDPARLREFGFPSTTNPDSCIGLYSADIYMALQFQKDAVLLMSKELWPDIQPVLTVKTKAPKCYVSLLFYKVRFQSLVRKDEVHSMVHGDCVPQGGCCGWIRSCCFE
jgi:hypothetical protein